MAYEIEVATVASRPIAAVRRRVLPGHVGSAWKPARDEVWAFLRARDGLWAGGHNVFVYRNPTNPGDPMEVDFGVEVTGAFEADGEVRPATTPTGLAASTTHVGSYDGLGDAHRAIDRWRAEHGRTFGPASWETYGEAGDDPAAMEIRVSYLIDP